MRPVEFVFLRGIKQGAATVVIFGEKEQPRDVIVFGHALSGRIVPRRTYRFCSLEISKAEAFENRNQEIKRKLGPGFGCISWFETFMRIRVMLFLYLHIENIVIDVASGFIWAIKHSLFNPVSHVYSVLVLQKNRNEKNVYSFLGYALFLNDFTGGKR